MFASLKTDRKDELNRLNPFSVCVPVHSICRSSPPMNVFNLQWLAYTVPVCVCVCKGRVWACGLSGEMPTKAPILGSKLIKVVEQMAQTWSGHNETVSGETNWTWQDSCEGFVRWPEFRHLPGVSLHSSQESGITIAWKLLSSFLRSTWIRRRLLPPNVCFQNNFYCKRIMPCQQGVFICFFSLPSSIIWSWQLVFGKHQILNTCCQRLFLSANSYQPRSNWHIVPLSGK